MAMVRMELTFWHKGKKPGDVVEVREEEVPQWFGFAKRLSDDQRPASEEPRDPDKAGAGSRAATGSPKTPPTTEKSSK